MSLNDAKRAIYEVLTSNERLHGGRRHVIDNQSLIMPLIPPLLNQTGNSPSAETISIPFSHQRVRARSIMMRAWVEKAEVGGGGVQRQPQPGGKGPVTCDVCIGKKGCIPQKWT